VLPIEGPQLLDGLGRCHLPDYVVDQEVRVYDREGCQDLGNRPRGLAEDLIPTSLSRNLEVAYNTAKKGDVQVDEIIHVFAVNHQVLFMLGLVHDFFEDSKVERID